MCCHPAGTARARNQLNPGLPAARPVPVPAPLACVLAWPAPQEATVTAMAAAAAPAAPAIPVLLRFQPIGGCSWRLVRRARIACAQVLPSPSLGPPLLSESWSPPPFCGMLPEPEALPPDPLPPDALPPTLAALRRGGGR